MASLQPLMRKNLSKEICCLLATGGRSFIFTLDTITQPKHELIRETAKSISKLWNST